jgi:hypothetical protein
MTQPIEASIGPTDSFDAVEWAWAFMECKKAWTFDDIDDSLMRGWFANAIMAGYDKGRADAAKDYAPARRIDLEEINRRLERLEMRMQRVEPASPRVEPVASEFDEALRLKK